MNTAGAIVGLILIIVFGVLALAAIIDNTKALNEEKALHVELQALQSEADAIGPDPTAEQVAALQARIDAFEQRLRVHEQSPFVVGKPL